MRAPLSPNERGWLYAAAYATSLALLIPVAIVAGFPTPVDLVVRETAGRGPAVYRPLPERCTAFQTATLTAAAPRPQATLDTYDRNEVRCSWENAPGADPEYVLTVDVHRLLDSMRGTTHADNVGSARARFREWPLASGVGGDPVTPVGGIGEEAKLVTSSVLDTGSVRLVALEGILVIEIHYASSGEAASARQAVAERLAAEVLRVLPPNGGGPVNGSEP